MSTTLCNAIFTLNQLDRLPYALFVPKDALFFFTNLTIGLLLSWYKSVTSFRQTGHRQAVIIVIIKIHMDLKYLTC